MRTSLHSADAWKPGGAARPTGRLRPPRRRGAALAAGVAALAAFATTALTAPAASAASTASVATAAARTGAGPAVPALHWTSCPYPDAPAELQCASIEVPVDHAHPDGPKATVTVDRLRATGAHPVGSLFFDPGGPGGSGTEFLYGEAMGTRLFSAATREHFDVIGVDPRGVGLSSPVRCDPALLDRRVSLFPEDEAAFRRLVDRNRELGESCRRLTGPLLDHVDTVSAARDLELLRRALGQGKLNYLGLSYGSQLGATYAELFPDRIRTMALDGALDHSLSTPALMRGETHAYEDSLDRFADWCARDTSCSLHGTDVGSLVDALVAQADRTPIPAPQCAEDGDCRTSVTGEDILLNVQNLLLFPARRADLALALGRARDGDASAFSPALATGPSDPIANGSALAIECQDWPTPVRTLDDLRRLRRDGQAAAPRLGGASQSWTILAGCAGWPAPVTNPPRPLHVRGAPPILITNATHDPSTAYPWAVRLERALPSGVLATRDGDGHTSYLAHGTSRTRDAIDDYLLTGRTPPRGTVYTD